MSIFTAPPPSGLERHAANFRNVLLTLWHGKQWQGSATVSVGHLDLHDDALAAKRDLLARLRETQADIAAAVDALAAEVATADRVAEQLRVAEVAAEADDDNDEPLPF